jgi:integrase
MASIEKRDKNTWRVVWREGGGNGHKRSRTFHDNKQARIWRATIDRNGQREPITSARLATLNPETDDERLELSHWADIWLSELTGVASRTPADYRRMIDLHILPTMGSLNVLDAEEFSRATVKAWVNDLHANGYSPKYIRNLHGLLYQIMQGLVTRDPRPLRTSNPCDKTRLPRRDATTERDQEMTFLTEDEFWLIHSLAHPLAQPTLVLLVGTGLRYSEMAALRISDIDLEATPPTLTVRRAWKEQADRSWALGPPKTKAGRRTIGLDPTVVEAVKRMAQDRPPDDLLLVNTAGRWIRNSRFSDSYWYPALRAAVEAGLSKRPRIHDLRHTHAAWLISAGVPLPVIQARLGHESIQTTVDVYGGLTRDAHNLAVDALAKTLSRRSLPG